MSATQEETAGALMADGSDLRKLRTSREGKCVSSGGTGQESQLPGGVFLD